MRELWPFPAAVAAVEGGLFLALRESEGAVNKTAESAAAWGL